MPTKRKSTRSRRIPSKSQSKNNLLIKKIGLVIFFFILVSYIIYHFREDIAYYFSFKSPHAEFHSSADTHKRTNQLIGLHTDKRFGIDISEYQGKIDWAKVDTLKKNIPIDFVLIRATAGKDKVDKKFMNNFEKAKGKGFLTGAYHYYRPNENSRQQAHLFIKTVQLTTGDLPPVLDIENIPKTQPMDSLKIGLKRWLNLVENHYGVKPIIYTGENYYNNHLKNDFYDYDFWIANYSKISSKLDSDWLFWQFTENGQVYGINHDVDINIFNGNRRQLKNVLID
jgi:lysozyme